MNWFGIVLVLLAIVGFVALVYGMLSGFFAFMQYGARVALRREAKAALGREPTEAELKEFTRKLMVNP